MNRAIIPIEFISAYLLNVNLDSFVGVSIKWRIILSNYRASNFSNY